MNTSSTDFKITTFPLSLRLPTVTSSLPPAVPLIDALISREMFRSRDTDSAQQPIIIEIIIEENRYQSLHYVLSEWNIKLHITLSNNTEVYRKCSKQEIYCKFTEIYYQMSQCSHVSFIDIFNTCRCYLPDWGQRRRYIHTLWSEQRRARLPWQANSFFFFFFIYSQEKRQ